MTTEPTMSREWKGKSVIITGAATGIGRAISNELASRGAIVYVTALSLGLLQAFGIGFAFVA